MYATPTNGFTPKGPKPVFIQIRDIPKGAAPITGEQLYICLTKIVPTEEITGVQRIGALWRVYLNSHDSRVKLISKGLEIRGVTVPVYDTNPFTQAKNEHLTRVTIKDVPLSVNDELISLTLARMKCQIRGEIMRQKLRVYGHLISCLNGDRVCYIEMGISSSAQASNHWQYVLRKAFSYWTATNIIEMFKMSCRWSFSITMPESSKMQNMFEIGPYEQHLPNADLR